MKSQAKWPDLGSLVGQGSDMGFAHHGSLGGGGWGGVGRCVGRVRGAINQKLHMEQPGEAQVCIEYWGAWVTPGCPQLSPISDGEGLVQLPMLGHRAGAPLQVTGLI